MSPPSDHTATPAGFHRNAWLASIGIGGWFRSESMADFVGIRTHVPPTHNLEGSVVVGVTHSKSDLPPQQPYDLSPQRPGPSPSLLVNCRISCRTRTGYQRSQVPGL